MKHPIRTALIAAMAVNVVAFFGRGAPPQPAESRAADRHLEPANSAAPHQPARAGRAMVRRSGLSEAIIALRGVQLPDDALFASTMPDEHLATYPSAHQAHVSAVAAYVHGTFVPRVRACLSELQPVGELEVTHSFVIDEHGMARAAAIPNQTHAAVEIVDADMDPETLPEIERCFALAAADTQFPHVPLDSAFSTQPFVAHQNYRFERRR